MIPSFRLPDERKYRISMGATALALLLTAPVSWNYFDLHLFMLTWSGELGDHWNVYADGNTNYPPLATYLFVALELLARETAGNPLVEFTPLEEINWVRIVARIPLAAGYLWTGHLLHRRFGWSVSRYWLFVYPALAAAVLVAVHPAFTVLTALSWTALIPLSVFFGYQFELLVVPLTVLALFSLLDDRPVRFGLLLAIGTLVKFYPALLFPLGLAQFGWREQARATAVFCGCVGLVSLPFVLSTPHEFYYQLFGFQGERFPQGLSPFHLPLLYLRYEVSAFPGSLRWLWQVVWLPLYGAILLVARRRSDTIPVVAAFAAVLLSMTALNKVGNLNYVVWSWPFLLVLASESEVSLRYVTGLVVTTVAYSLVFYLPAAVLDRPVFIVQDLAWYDARWLLVNSFQGVSEGSMLSFLRLLEIHLGGQMAALYRARYLVLSVVIVVHFALHVSLLWELARTLRAADAVKGAVARRFPVDRT